MEKKCEFTEETKEIDGHILHRIKALRDFGSVKKGDLGGWIESEKNLSHNGNAWVLGDAQVYENGWVYERALIYKNARVYGNAQIYGNARVFENAWVNGNTQIKKV